MYSVQHKYVGGVTIKGGLLAAGGASIVAGSKRIQSEAERLREESCYSPKIDSTPRIPASESQKLVGL